MPHGSAGVDPHLLVLLSRMELFRPRKVISEISRIGQSIVLAMIGFGDDRFILVHWSLLIESEGWYYQKAVVVVRGEYLGDGEQLLVALLPDLTGGDQVEEEADDEDDRKSPDGVHTTGPIGGGGDVSRTLEEEVLGEC